MKRLAAILLLSACSQEPADTGDEADAAAPPPAAQENVAGNPAALQERVDQAMAAVLQDPDGARYRNVRAGLAGTVCGEVNPRRTRGGHAGFRPFLLTPDGVARVAAAQRLTFDDATDTFPDFYIRWCATAEELKRLEPELRRAIARSGASGPAGEPLSEEPALDALPADPGGPPAAPPDPAPGSQAESRPADVDSFVNSVKRKRDESPPKQ